MKTLEEIDEILAQLREDWRSQPEHRIGIEFKAKGLKIVRDMAEKRLAREKPQMKIDI